MLKFQKGQPGSKLVPQILTLQGHPELQGDILPFLLNIRLQSEEGLTSEEEREAWDRVGNKAVPLPTDFRRAGWAVLNFYLSEA